MDENHSIKLNANIILMAINQFMCNAIAMKTNNNSNSNSKGNGNRQHSHQWWNEIKLHCYVTPKTMMHQRTNLGQCKTGKNKCESFKQQHKMEHPVFKVKCKHPSKHWFDSLAKMDCLATEQIWRKTQAHTVTYTRTHSTTLVTNQKHCWTAGQIEMNKETDSCLKSELSSTEDADWRRKKNETSKTRRNNLWSASIIHTQTHIHTDTQTDANSQAIIAHLNPLARK